jgi:hypothetical protein
MGQPVGTVASRSAKNRPIASVSVNTRNFTEGVCVVNVCAALGGTVSDEPAPSSWCDSSTRAVIQPCSARQRL